jgi:hypothetical protein
MMEKDHLCYMGVRDWDPIIEALTPIVGEPRCGSVAQELINMFIAAQDGKYYCIEIAYENMKGRCFIKGTEFIPPRMKKNAEDLANESTGENTKDHTGEEHGT